MFIRRAITSLFVFAVLFRCSKLQSKVGRSRGTPSSDHGDPEQKPTKREALCTRELTTLKLLSMLPYTESILPKQFRPSWDQGLDILPALDLAAEQINNRSDILPCHQLELVHIDGGCDIVPKTNLGIVSNLYRQQERDTDDQTIVGVIGPGCSVSAIQMSTIANRPKVELVVLHDAGSPLLADRTKYKNSIGILGSIHPFVDLAIALVRDTKWRHVAILYDGSRPYHRSAAEMFASRLKNQINDVNILFQDPVYGMFYPLLEVRDSLARIVFLFVPLQHSLKIMCLAYRWRLVYPGYQWILIGRSMVDFMDSNGSRYLQNFTYDGKQYNCSYEALQNTAISNSFMINYQFSDESSERQWPLLNATFHEFLQLYEARVDEYNDTISPTYWAYNMYDAVWAWAIVLDRLTSRYDEITFEYGNKTLAKMILDEFYSLNFQGISGNISFNSSDGFVNRQAILYQVVNGSELCITSTKGTNNSTIIFPKDSYTAIPDIVKVIGLPHKELICFFIIFQCLEFLVAVALHLLTIVYRKSKSVKASSLQLSQLIFIGLYLFIIATLVLSISKINEYTPEISSIFCQVLWVWLFPFSFTLIIGTVAVRTWRLYRIFTHYMDPGKFISTFALVLILLNLLLIDLFIAVVWTSTDPMQQVLVNFTVENGPANELMLERMCSSSSLNLLWIALSHSYRIVLLMFVVMLTILTRSIPNKSFTTSSLGVFLYTFTTVYFLGFIVYYSYLLLFNNHNPNTDYGILSITFNTMICLIIACIIVPPLLPIARGKVFQTLTKT